MVSHTNDPAPARSEGQSESRVRRLGILVPALVTAALILPVVMAKHLPLLDAPGHESRDRKSVV